MEKGTSEPVHATLLERFVHWQGTIVNGILLIPKEMDMIGIDQRFSMIFHFVLRCCMILHEDSNGQISWHRCHEVAVGSQ